MLEPLESQKKTMVKWNAKDRVYLYSELKWLLGRGVLLNSDTQLVCLAVLTCRVKVSTGFTAFTKNISPIKFLFIYLHKIGRNLFGIKKNGYCNSELSICYLQPLYITRSTHQLTFTLTILINQSINRPSFTLDLIRLFQTTFSASAKYCYFFL